MSLLNIQYQKRDLDFHDYNMGGGQLSSGDFIYFRDLPEGINFSDINKNSFSIIGPAFSLGCHVETTFGKLIENKTGLKQYNFSLQGSSAATYLRSDLKDIIDAINKTKFCIVTAFSGRSESNSVFHHSDKLFTYEKLYKENNKNPMPAHKLFEEYLETHGHDKTNKLINENVINYIENCKQLFNLINVPVIFLWFSKRSPEAYSLSNNHEDIFKKMGMFPHFIGSDTIKKITPYTDYYVEAISHEGSPQLLFDRWNGDVAEVKKDPVYGYSVSNYNRYYATPLMHLNAYNKLLPVLSEITGNQYNLDTNHILFSSVGKVLKDLHFSKFIHFNRKLKIYVDDFFFNAMNNCFEDKEYNNALFYPFSTQENKNNKPSVNYDLSLTIRNEFRVDNSCLFSYLLCKNKPFHLFNENKIKYKHSLNNLNYAILTSPRSGSTMLCSVLKKLDIGDPKEHIRDSFVQIFNNDKFYSIKKDKLFDQMVKFGSVKSKKDQVIFGTKIISHFFSDIEEKKHIVESLKKFKLIRLIRKDKIAQVTSILRARKTKVWHKFKDSKDNVSFQNPNAIDVTKEEIINCYYNLLEQEAELDLLQENLGKDNVFTVYYEELVDNPNSKYKDLIYFLCPELDSYDEDLLTPSTEKIAKSTNVDELYLKIKEQITSAIKE